MKRKFLENSLVTTTDILIGVETRSVKRKRINRENVLFNTKVSGTEIRNAMKKDWLADYLIHFHKKNTPISQSQSNYRNISNNNFNSDNCKDTWKNTIMQKGNEFEEKIIEELKTKFVLEKGGDYVTEYSLRRVFELMKKGIPIIYQAPLYNYDDNTQGIADLLVRSDYLDKLTLFPSYEYVENSSIIAPLLFNEQNIEYSNTKTYHYVVIDIKFSTIPLRVDARHIQNTENYPAYKGQLCIYNRALGKLQGYTPDEAYIYGRRTKIRNILSQSSNERLGVINFSTIDNEYLHLTDEAIKWIKLVKTEGHSWTLNPPCRPELYPNMSVDDNSWISHAKKEIAKNIKEITCVWNLGYKQRLKAHSKGIMSWDDSRCNCSEMEINGKNKETIDKILDINRIHNSQDETFLLQPLKISINISQWTETENEMFVDFETLSDIFTNNEQIFLIGIYSLENNDKKYKYTSFLCKDKTKEEELRILEDFLNFIQNKIRENKSSPLIRFWSAEEKFWKRAINRHPELIYKYPNVNLIWTDINLLFTQTPIVLRDCLNFKLKSIVSAMKKHGMIDTQLDSTCDNGLTAMVKANNCYDKCLKENSNVKDNIVMKDIINYNIFDCKAILDILTYLRSTRI